MTESSTTEPQNVTLSRSELKKLLLSATKSGWALARKYPNHVSFTMSVDFRRGITFDLTPSQRTPPWMQGD